MELKEEKEILKIDEITFGKIDAHNELQEVGYDYYANSFLKYDKYRIDKFWKGEKYYICGDKGTGKTALLKYLECKLVEDSANLVIPVRFKTQFDEEDRKLMTVAANVREEVVDSLPEEKINSYIFVWQTYIIHQILKSEEEGEYQIFEITDNLLLLKKLLRSMYEGQEGRIVPKLTKGYVSLSASSLKGLAADVQLEIEFNNNTHKVNFSKMAKKIFDLYQELIPKSTPVYILMDELELSVNSKKNHNRDVQLVRDLIVAIARMNEIAKIKYYNVNIFASIRNDVISSILSHGYEINKCVEDFGVQIDWFQKGGNYIDSPLLGIIESKINASEIRAGIKKSNNVWEKYFESTINEMEVRRYILSFTWQRPRDIIRMMNSIQEQYKNENKITQEMFDRAMQTYSERSWNEIAEELKLIYSGINDIKAIKKFFTGIQVPFSYGYLVKRSEELGEIYDYVHEFFEKNKMIDFLEKMFDWGVIGNSGKRMIFKFLGDDELQPTSDMIIHRPLRNFFAVTSKR